MMNLEAASVNAPPGLVELIADLGDGENGFGGTPVFKGEMTLPEYLQHCIEMTDLTRLKPGYVPQTTFWVIDPAGEAVGMVRIRHYLNEQLKERGGHIGYYIRRDQRGKGYGRAALCLALGELSKMGQRKALLTVHLDNLGSIKVIEANGGRLESIGQHLDGKQFGRYWIELACA